MSYKPQVQVTGEPGKWHSNAMVFATESEAYRSALSLLARWSACTDCRAIESTDPVNYVIIGDKEMSLPAYEAECEAHSQSLES
jgi:hypothetical protein